MAASSLLWPVMENMEAWQRDGAVGGARASGGEAAACPQLQALGDTLALTQVPAPCLRSLHPVLSSCTLSSVPHPVLCSSPCPRSLHPVLGSSPRPSWEMGHQARPEENAQTGPSGGSRLCNFSLEARCPMKHSCLEAPLPQSAPVPPRQLARAWGALRGPREPVFLRSNLEVHDQGWREPRGRRAGVGVIVC